jgi:hypothetical protein
MRANMASRQKDFYSGVYNNARAMGLSDAQARLAASQASLETGFGRSSVGNNYFGVKAGKSWNGPVTNAGTWENVNGRNVNTRANFRAYDNPAESLTDWSSTVSRNFPSSYWADDFDTAVSGLSNGRFGAYASDPNYGSKLRSIDQRNYGPDLGIMSAFDIPPTPTQRPSDNPFDAILTPAAYQPSFPATPSPVQREALPDVSPLSFDYGRFPTTGKTSRLPADVPSQFDAERFPTTAPPATTPQQLQRGLLDQALDAGELPGLLGPATSWPGQAPAPVAGYVDPRVTTQPASIETAAVQAPETTASISPGGGLLSPAEAAQVQQQQGLLGGPLQHSTPAQIADIAARNQQAMQRQNLLGGLGGGLLGGLVLGPVGAIAGGLLGKTVASRNFYPEAPKPQQNSKNDRSLNDYGRSVANQSSQFSRAMSKGGVGLY